jgi:hypothetical protein
VVYLNVANIINTFILHTDYFLEGYGVYSRRFHERKKNFEERSGWLSLPFKYSIAFIRFSVYSAAFLLSGMATCTAIPLVNRILVESLDGSLTRLGKIEMGVLSVITSIIACLRSSWNVRFGSAWRKTPISHASTSPRDTWLT